MKFSSTSNTSVKLVSQFPISKSAPPVLLKPWVRIKKNGKPIVLIITLVLQDYPLGYILWYFYKPLRVLSLQNFFFFFFHFLSNLIPPFLLSHHGWWKFSNLWCFDDWKNAFTSQKIELNLDIFIHVPSAKNLPRVIITPKTEGNYSFYPRSDFFENIFSPSKIGGGKTMIGFLSHKNNLFNYKILPTESATISNPYLNLIHSIKWVCLHISKRYLNFGKPYFQNHPNINGKRFIYTSIWSCERKY